MGYVYKRGRRLWIGFTDATGHERQKSTGFDVGQEREAQDLLDEVEAQVASGFTPDGKPLTVREWSDRWLKAREAAGVASTPEDRTRLERHGLPPIGALVLRDVRPRHWRAVLVQLKAEKKLAPRTIRHLHGLVHKLFEDAVVEELLTENPIKVKRGDLPKKADKDPAWRAGAVFTREEVEALLSDTRVPLERRILHAMWFCAGLRRGESAARRWRDYDNTLEPLGCLLVATAYNSKRKVVKDTKSEVPRRIPVHPVLARLLAEWRLELTRRLGHAPDLDSFIVPGGRGGIRSGNIITKRFRVDLAKLELRHRRVHDGRRTMISLARADGASKDVLRIITHGPSGDVMDDYTTLPWAALCAEVQKLNIELRGDREVTRLPLRAVAGGPVYQAATGPLTAHLQPIASTRNERQKVVGAAGFEPTTPCSQSKCSNQTELRPDSRHL